MNSAQIPSAGPDRHTEGMLDTQLQSKQLPLREKLGYGIGDMANGLAISATAFYLLFYLTNVVKLSPELAGTALMIGRIWDALTDPVMGWITDKTNSRWGKRRPYLLFGALTYGLSFFALWAIPEFARETATFIHVVIVLICFNTFLTVVFIPYQTLTAAMTSDSLERSSLMGYRMVLSQVAFLAGAVLPILIVRWTKTPEVQALLDRLGLNTIFGSWAGTDNQGYLFFAAIFGIAMMVVIWIAFFFTREREVSASETPGPTFGPLGYVTALVKLAVSNRYFRASLFIKLFSTCAATIVSAQLKYYITYVLDRGKDFPSIIGVLFISAIISVPLWVWLSKKRGKVEAFRIGMWGYSAVLLLMLLLGQSAASVIYPLAVVAGVFHCAALLIPWTIIPDVVEVDEFENGQRREGLLYGGTTFAYKLGSGLSIFIAGYVLAISGFDPEMPDSRSVVWGISLATTLIPTVLLVLSILASRSYDLTAKRHAEIVAALKARGHVSR